MFSEIMEEELDKKDKFYKNILNNILRILEDDCDGDLDFAIFKVKFIIKTT